MVVDILVFDPATTTGWAVMNETDKKPQLVDYGFFKTKSRDNEGDELIEIMFETRKLINQWQPKHIVIEDYFFSRRCRQGSNKNPSVRAAIHIMARLLDISYTIVNPVFWKKHISGHVRPTKQEIKIYGREKSKKEMIRQALDKHYNIKFDDTITHNGKQLKLKYDYIDATAMGIYYIENKAKLNTRG